MVHNVARPGAEVREAAYRAKRIFGMCIYP